MRASSLCIAYEHTKFFFIVNLTWLTAPILHNICFLNIKAGHFHHPLIQGCNSHVFEAEIYSQSQHKNIEWLLL
jgi:hypothetical protein